MELGFLRENEKAVKKATEYSKNGEKYTGLDEYLKKIFPHVGDWVHNKATGIILEDGSKCNLRPDYRSESLKTIIEFDGLGHFTNPKTVLKDMIRNEIFKEAGYRLVVIPYFIQLTDEVIYSMFEERTGFGFSDKVPSFDISLNNTPAFMCDLGLQVCAEYLEKYESQGIVNIEALKRVGEPLSGYSALYQKFSARFKKLCQEISSND